MRYSALVRQDQDQSLLCSECRQRHASQLLLASILDVHTFKNYIAKHGGAPKTINRSISLLSSFYKFLSGGTRSLRLPITVPKRAPAQFISRESSDPVEKPDTMNSLKNWDFHYAVMRATFVQ